ncbi:hypothetical protein AAFF_G00199180 [Aldrovandia affinis]|uniref:Zinc finger protein 750 n=1 Tax=Aldrovandia affinis TaxID=143900 RepID=A0AAD7RIV4_9TELE|nr:hypothetical protein AAFF_G00199180 [Aldrovandia affinis]
MSTDGTRRPKRPHYVPRPPGKPFRYRCFQCPFTCDRKSHLFSHAKYDLCEASISLAGSGKTPTARRAETPPSDGPATPRRGGGERRRRRSPSVPGQGALKVLADPPRSSPQPRPAATATGTGRRPPSHWEGAPLPPSPHLRSTTRPPPPSAPQHSPHSLISRRAEPPTPATRPPQHQGTLSLCSPNTCSASSTAPRSCLWAEEAGHTPYTLTS